MLADKRHSEESVIGWNPNGTFLFMSSAVCKPWSCIGILSSSICIRDGCADSYDACCGSSGWPLSNIRHPQRSLHQSCSLSSSTPTMVQATQLFHCIHHLVASTVACAQRRQNYTFSGLSSYINWHWLPVWIWLPCTSTFGDGWWGLDVIPANHVCCLACASRGHATCGYLTSGGNWVQSNAEAKRCSPCFCASSVVAKLLVHWYLCCATGVLITSGSGSLGCTNVTGLFLLLWTKSREVFSYFYGRGVSDLFDCFWHPCWLL